MGRGQGCLLEDRYFMCVLFCFCVVNIIHLNVRSRAKENSFVFPRVLMSRENKTNWFPEGPCIKCFVISLDFHFNSNKRITRANQKSRLGTYNNTNLILKTTE